MPISTEQHITIKILKNRDFSSFKTLTYSVFILLLTIVGILTLMSRINSMLNWFVSRLTRFYYKVIIISELTSMVYCMFYLFMFY